MAGMSDEKMLPFEQQFDEKPTRIGGFTLMTDEMVGVYIHEGRVDCPVFPPQEVIDDLESRGEDVVPFLLAMTPREARDLAGLLIYASGRAEEHAAHCVDCGTTIHDDEDEEVEIPDDVTEARLRITEDELRRGEPLSSQLTADEITTLYQRLAHAAGFEPGELIRRLDAAIRDQDPD